MAKQYKYQADYIIGYSRVKETNTILSKFQSTDFKMLMFSSLGTTSLGTPTGCSGQNQSYNRNVFLKDLIPVSPFYVGRT